MWSGQLVLECCPHLFCFLKRVNNSDKQKWVTFRLDDTHNGSSVRSVEFICGSIFASAVDVIRNQFTEQQTLSSCGGDVLSQPELIDAWPVRVDKKWSLRGQPAHHWNERGIKPLSETSSDPDPLRNFLWAVRWILVLFVHFVSFSSLSQADYIDMAEGRLDGMSAFMQGKLQISGDMMAAQAFAPAVQKLRDAAGTASKLWCVSRWEYFGFFKPF